MFLIILALLTRRTLDILCHMTASQAYTQKQRHRAVNLSAFLGWLMVAAPYILSQFNPLMWLWVAAISLPISYIVCWIVVAPVLQKIMRHPISWSNAACWGAIISSLIAATCIAIGRYLGWRQSINPNFHSRIGGDNSIRSIDGILTPYGWLILAQTTVLFIVGGVIIALILRAAIGPGEAPKHPHIVNS